MRIASGDPCATYGGIYEGSDVHARHLSMSPIMIMLHLLAS